MRTAGARGPGSSSRPGWTRSRSWLASRPALMDHPNIARVLDAALRVDGFLLLGHPDHAHAAFADPPAFSSRREEMAAAVPVLGRRNGRQGRRDWPAAVLTPSL